MTDPATELTAARRRIDQLEAALMRRTETLEQKQAELADIKAGKVFRAAHLVNRVIERLFPLYSRRRTIFKRTVKAVFSLPTLLWNRRKESNGPPPEERFFTECTPPEEYRRWRVKWEPTAADLAKQRTKVFGRTPVFSVVVPVYNPPEKFLVEMVESVIAQTYPHWELCLADASTVPHVKPVLDRFAAKDKRVKVKNLAENGGIAGNSNAALAMATGEYVALLDHDDTLAPFALFEMAAAVNASPDADFLYSDEDKLDPGGERCEPGFKPDWSPETLRSRNYICHLTVLKRSLVEKLGGFRSGYDGAQDYDLVLRAGEVAKKVVHVPAVLYHWRMHPQSTAANNGSKEYAFEAGRKAVADHLDRLGIDAAVSHGAVQGTYRVHYRLRRQPLVSVIIPNKDHPEMLARCVNSLSLGSYANYELLIVENGSTDPGTFTFYEQLKKQPHVKVLEWTRPFNYAAVNNFAVNHAKGDLVLFLNNDVLAITPDWLEAMVKLAEQPGVGAVGAKLYYPDDTVQHAGVVVGMGGVAGHSHVFFPRGVVGYMQRLVITQNVAAVTGACLLMPRHVFDTVGGFDEGYVLAFNDIDLCLAVLRAGYRVVWTPDAELYHLESKTRGKEDTLDKLKRFQREYALFQTKWGEFLKQGDPYYSPHFRLDRSDFALKAA